MRNVHSIEHQRQLRDAYERQRQRAAQALRRASVEFRRLEELERHRR